MLSTEEQKKGEEAKKQENEENEENEEESKEPLEMENAATIIQSRNFIFLNSLLNYLLMEKLI